MLQTDDTDVTDVTDVRCQTTNYSVNCVITKQFNQLKNSIFN